MPLNDTNISLSVRGTLTSALDLVSASAALQFVRGFSLDNGTGAGQADKIFSDTRTIAASATDSLDLAGGVLFDALGAGLTFVKVKGVFVAAASGNTNNVNVTRPAANGVPWFLAAGDGIPVLPGGVFAWGAPGAGITVTAGTGDLIDIVNSAGGSTVTYDIVIIGTSA